MTIRIPRFVLGLLVGYYLAGVVRRARQLLAWPDALAGREPYRSTWP